MISTTIEASLLILAVEFGLIATGIAFFAYRNVRSDEVEATAEASELVSKVSDSEDTRRTALETVFKNKYQYEGEQLTAVVDEFLEREKAFYNAVVGAFLGRGENKITDLDSELRKVVAPWISITPANVVDAHEAESVAEQKSLIEAELDETKKVLEKMMREYSGAFRPSASDAPAQPAFEEELVTHGDVGTESKFIDESLLSVSSEEGIEKSDPNELMSMTELADDSDEPDSEVEQTGSHELEAIAEFENEVDGELVFEADTSEVADADEGVDLSEPLSAAGDSDQISEKIMTAEDLDDLIEGLATEPEPQEELEAS